MSVFEPNFRHLREVLIFCLHLKKTATDAHRMLSSTYGEAALNKRKCREWFQRFKSVDFGVEDEHGAGKEKIFEDSELKALHGKLHIARVAILERSQDYVVVVNTIQRVSWSKVYT